MRRIFFEPTFLTKQRLSKEESQASMAYIQELENCRPDKPLERGELFALAMQDYWQRKMKRVWKLDDLLTDTYKDFDPLITKISFVEESCALQCDECVNPICFGNHHCYPRKINDYHTRNLLFSEIKWKNL